MAYTSFADLSHAARTAGLLAAAAIEREVLETGESSDTVRARAAESLAVMRHAVAEGRAGRAPSRSGLAGGDAAKLAVSRQGPLGGAFAEVLTSSVAVAEVNAAMGRIVAAPTGGSSGIVPGVLITLADERSIPDEKVVDALLASAAIGAVVATRTSLSGAAAGCQAEIGVAAAMAAAGAVEMLGGTPEAAGHAASLALQGLMGLVCDPVGGLVEVPCVLRNATGAAVALSACEMALAGVEFPIPFDEVADALAQVGRSLPPTLRETAAGGLAITPTGRRLAAEALGPNTG